MATLAPSGRINEDLVAEEVARLSLSWSRPKGTADGDLLAELIGAEALAGIDLFDRVQLASVVRVCRGSKTLSAAGRTLFAASRAAKVSSNDADRLKKYLARFGLSWDQVSRP
jgi:transcriptional regulatory protein RtcR